MKRLLFLTWGAIAVIAWRQESLEQATTEFTTAAMRMIDTAVNGMEGRVRDAFESASERASQN